jgi:hypothetical protein
MVQVAWAESRALVEPAVATESLGRSAVAQMVEMLARVAPDTPRRVQVWPAVRVARVAPAGAVAHWAAAVMAEMPAPVVPASTAPTAWMEKGVSAEPAVTVEPEVLVVPEVKAEPSQARPVMAGRAAQAG